MFVTIMNSLEEAKKESAILIINSDITNKVLLVGDKCMPEVHMRQHRFSYSVCRRCTQNKEKIKIQKFKETGY